MTLDEWKSIKTGQTIFSKSGVPRLVTKGCGGALCVSLVAIRKTRYGGEETVYDRQCCKQFFLSPPEKEKENHE